MRVEEAAGQREGGEDQGRGRLSNARARRRGCQEVGEMRRPGQHKEVVVGGEDWMMRGVGEDGMT